MTRILAIDPGPQESAWVLYDSDTRRLIDWEKNLNLIVKDRVSHLSGPEVLAVEKIASYGMPAGESLFETCVWTGRLIEAWSHRPEGDEWFRFTRKQIVTWLCGNPRAGDSNVHQALIDMFGPDKAHAVGVKKSPGPLYGLAGHGWAALDVAVYAADCIALDKAIEAA